MFAINTHFHYRQNALPLPDIGKARGGRDGGGLWAKDTQLGPFVALNFWTAAQVCERRPMDQDLLRRKNFPP